jgi:photosystem II stability/assembly factor-like uncharacterized protein
MIRYCLSVAVVIATLATMNLAGQTFTPLLRELSHTVVLNPRDPNKFWIGNTEHQTFHTTDGGQTWALVATGEIGNSGNVISSGTQHAIDTNIYLVGGWRFDGIRRSTNSGASFERVFSDGFTRSWFISDAIVASPSNPDVFYAARGSDVNGIYRSTDKGETWSLLATIPRNTTTRICTITLSPHDPNLILLGCLSGVIMRSTDGGATFQPATLEGSTTIKRDTEFPKIVHSRQSPGTVWAVAAISSPENVSGNGGLWRSTDDGATWSRIAFRDTSLWSLELVPRPEGEELWVGGFRIETQPTVIKGDGILASSRNAGQSWTFYDDFPWGFSNTGDTVKNTWMFRYQASTGKLFLAMQTGLFVHETGITSLANQGATPPRTLRVRATTTGIRVFDDAPSHLPAQWSVYDTQGREVAQGNTISQGTLDIPLLGVSCGTYLLKLGTPHLFRTCAFTLAP